jgi:hypothetical protein
VTTLAVSVSARSVLVGIEGPDVAPGCPVPVVDSFFIEAVDPVQVTPRATDKPGHVEVDLRSTFIAMAIVGGSPREGDATSCSLSASMRSP